MIVLQVAGFSGSGKTTVLAAIAAALREEGRPFAFIKHHHGRIESPKTDTERLAAGAVLRVLAAADGLLAVGRAPQLSELLAAAARAGAEVALVEGFKTEPGAKLWLRRDAADAPPEAVPDVAWDLCGGDAMTMPGSRLWRRCPRRDFLPE